MIFINFSASTVEVEPDGNANRLALVETLETVGSPSSVEHHHDNTLDVIRSDIHATSRGGRVARVSREYTLRKSGGYVITSGLRENDQSRVFHIHLSPVENGHIELTVTSSPNCFWIVGDERVLYSGGTMKFTVELGDVIEVENKGQTEFKRQTSWDHILGDDDDSAV